MTITIDATYEDGVLKPAQPLPLSEHAQVRVTIEPHLVPDVEGATAGKEPSLAEKLMELASALPRETVESWPTDGASQHDHYLYGTPKRPE